ncbi:MAG TPA: hypothetical protein VFP18_00395 [Candidatus Binatia bacterium]|nr:hypothetical protein [Candidatus Binatia bacterium]
MRILDSFTLIIFLFLLTPAAASNHYTEKQLDALETRVGKTFWISVFQEKLPSFATSPTSDASVFQPTDNESFEITELVGRKAKNPYYKVKFDSGAEGYIHAQAFHEQFNGTILTIDPRADEKKALAEKSREEKARIEWIQTQPWSAAVKESAIKRQAVRGMTAGEVKRVVGDPRRVSRIKGPQHSNEEHWFYPDGTLLIFRNGALNRIETTKKAEP